MIDKDLCLAEIQQLHNAVSDFSHQSISIKKLSITIYLAFLSIYFGFRDDSPTMPSAVFWIIGILIPVFCYIYEIYIDYTRQRLRARMNNLCRKFEVAMTIPPRQEKRVRVRFLMFELGRNAASNRVCLYRRRNYTNPAESFYYIDLLHLMYTIYLIEILITVMTGCILRSSYL